MSRAGDDSEERPHRAAIALQDVMSVKWKRQGPSRHAVECAAPLYEAPWDLFLVVWQWNVHLRIQICCELIS